MRATLEIDFPPKFAMRWKPEAGGARHIARILDARIDAQRAFLTEMARFGDNFRQIPNETDDPASPRWTQNWFPPLDGMSSYTLAASKNPDTLIEIGSGNSTKFFAQARKDHGLKTRIVSIDPHPREEIDTLCDTVHRYGLEDVDLSVFDTLKAGDILFFDGSHRAFQNSDVTVFFIDVLPRLADGVTVGIHDIFWPVDYPEAWLERYYNEQYMLAAYMLAFGDHVPLVFSCSHAWRALGDEVKAAVPDDLLARLKRVSGGCLWFEKRTIAGLA